jgi:7,8-dihydropterin-6-yl-methyl-4-(beta-D-ribofuranosyl)aminobenzene 5'-phosphate synthase
MMLPIQNRANEAPPMSLRDKAYEIYWSMAGLVRPFTLARYLRERRAADEAWRQSRPQLLSGLGCVEKLSILPLVDFYAAPSAVTGSKPSFATEPGVSYLVKADDRLILFDVGYNQQNEHPSPLLHNMAVLGISPDSLDAVVISHLHLDHVGGPRCQNTRTFALSAQDVDLRGIPAYTPTPMVHPTATVETVIEGRALGDGIASTGPLARAIWLTGTISEQSLLVNVKGKGLVVLVGCGHPSLERILSRAQALVEAPVHGVIGGLHFPVTKSRVGKGRQNIIGSGKLPWQRIRRGEARAAVAALKRLDPQLVALSAHDSCDWTISLFRDSFGDRYQEVLVGQEIVVS